MGPRRAAGRDWLAARLQHTYPQFAGSAGAAEAAGLIMASKVAVILDGLDEIRRNCGRSPCRR